MQTLLHPHLHAAEVFYENGGVGFGDLPEEAMRDGSESKWWSDPPAWIVVTVQYSTTYCSVAGWVGNWLAISTQAHSISNPC